MSETVGATLWSLLKNTPIPRPLTPKMREGELSDPLWAVKAPPSLWEASPENGGPRGHRGLGWGEIEYFNRVLWVAQNRHKTYRLCSDSLPTGSLSPRQPKDQGGKTAYAALRLGGITFANKATSSLSWTNRIRHQAVFFLCLCFLLFAASLAQAQDGLITDNAVNAVAEKMYCPVCENIPLDECQTRACLEWKEEIRLQLAAGKDESAVIDSFVQRFGDGVVGIPQDPVLRGLTVLTPLLALFLALALGARAFSRFRVHQPLSIADEADLSATAAENHYRQRLEEDLAARR